MGTTLSRRVESQAFQENLARQEQQRRDAEQHRRLLVQQQQQQLACQAQQRREADERQRLRERQEESARQERQRREEDQRRLVQQQQQLARQAQQRREAEERESLRVRQEARQEQQIREDEHARIVAYQQQQQQLVREAQERREANERERLQMRFQASRRGQVSPTAPACMFEQHGTLAVEKRLLSEVRNRPRNPADNEVIKRLIVEVRHCLIKNEWDRSSNGSYSRYDDVLHRIAEHARCAFDLQVEDLLQWHFVCLENLHNCAGRLRTRQVRVGSHRGVSREFVNIAMLWYVDAVTKVLERTDISGSAKAAWCSYHLVDLHPFEDGNGRLSRVVAIWALHKHFSHNDFMQIPSFRLHDRYCSRSAYIRAVANRDPRKCQILLASHILNCWFSAWKSCGVLHRGCAWEHVFWPLASTWQAYGHIVAYNGWFAEEDSATMGEDATDTSRVDSEITQNHETTCQEESTTTTCYESVTVAEDETAGVEEETTAVSDTETNVTEHEAAEVDDETTVVSETETCQDETILSEDSTTTVVEDDTVPDGEESTTSVQQSSYSEEERWREQEEEERREQEDDDAAEEDRRRREEEDRRRQDDDDAAEDDRRRREEEEEEERRRQDDDDYYYHDYFPYSNESDPFDDDSHPFW
mmetsp:Transcript_14596/g.22880  ORF Transcript_14596/g.22880 Transcript_14596/m.22880 type:complete len:645 (-) Transcript_14596:27-1961(-)